MNIFKNGSFFKKAILASAVVVVVVSCGFRKEKDVPNNLPQSAFIDREGRITIPADKAPGFNTVKAIVFQNKCIRCHGHAGGVNLESFASARASLNDIAREVVLSGTMPPKGPLSGGEIQLVDAWIKAGGPEQDVAIDVEPAITPTPTTTPTPVPSATPNATPATLPEPSATPFGKVVYADVNTAIFTAKCIKCHNDNHAAGDINLTTYQNVIANLTEVEEQALIKLTMPPKKQPLSADEQLLLRTWIDQGANQ